jgi:hypothetical protein
VTAATQVRYSDAEILESLAASDELPSKNAIMRSFGAGSPRAIRLRRMAQTDRSPVHLCPPVCSPEPPAPVSVPDELPASEPALPGSVPGGERGETSPWYQPPCSIRDWLVARRLVLLVCAIALPAFVAIWSGWVGMGALTGFGWVTLLPGIAPLRIDTAITLPIGLEVYAVAALHTWLTARPNSRLASYARTSAIVALCIGASGQVAWHVMSSAGLSQAPVWVTVLVACLPVAVVGMGTALATLIAAERSV